MALAATVLSAGAQVPGLLHYQGRLLVGNTVFDGPGQFKFALANADGSVIYWRNAPDVNSDGQPDSALSLTLNRGLYSVQLGDTNMAALPASVFTNSAVYLQVWFNDGTNGFQALKPDQRLTTVGYAMIAGTVADGAVTMAKLAPGALNAANLTGALLPAQIPNLDASKTTSGRFDPARLPANVAYKDTDLLSTSNALAASLQATNAVLVAQMTALLAQIDLLAGRLSALSNHVEASIPPGLTVVSTTGLDAALAIRGYESFMTVPAPAWTSGTTTDALTARYGHAGIWTGQALIIWGGNLGSGFLSGSGGLYDPALDQWQTVSPVDAPAARSGHTAVWTGQEMMVWGGYASGNYLNTGGRFHPGNQQWNPLPTEGAPSERQGHVAVWPGDRMIVWGGRNGEGLLATGAWYEVATNQWQPLLLAEAPTARYGATAVWTGDRLVVWGGEGLEGALNNGRQLVVDAQGRPVAWRSVSLDNAPTARSGHTAVWTGQKMIVWGGQNNGVFLGDGAAYDPVADVWAPLPSAGAPASRSGHCALWTGQVMIVHGGENAAGALASGSAYHPASGQWRGLSSAGNPTPRFNAISVWTGNELLVFGGRAAGQPVGSLQRLNPQPTWYFYHQP